VEQVWSAKIRSVATQTRYLRRILHRGDSKRKWLAFLQNHREVIAAMDFFTRRP
jgi:hypothetical protein